MSIKKMIATKIISDRLQQLIDETGIKKGKLALKIGVTPGAISQMLSGKSGASAQTIKYLASEFNVNEEWLEYGIGEKEIKYEVTTVFTPVSQQTSPKLQTAYELLQEETDEELEDLIYKLLQKKRTKRGGLPQE